MKAKRLLTVSLLLVLKTVIYGQTPNCPGSNIVYTLTPASCTSCVDASISGIITNASGNSGSYLLIGQNPAPTLTNVNIPYPNYFNLLYSNNTFSINGLYPGSNYTILAIPNYTVYNTPSGGMVGPNLVNNFDFSSNYNGFASDYSKLPLSPTVNIIPIDSGRIWAVASPSVYYNFWGGTGYGGSGNFLLVDGAKEIYYNLPYYNPNYQVKEYRSFWTQTITVTPNTLYNLNYYYQNLNVNNNNKNSSICVEINNQWVDINPLNNFPVNTWLNRNLHWFSGSATSAVIKLKDRNAYWQNGIDCDFGIDNILFREVYVPCIINSNPLTTSTIENDNVKSTIRIYPNPISNNLFINSETAITKIEILNSIGQLMLSKENINTISTTLDVSQLPTGIYFVQLQSADRMVTKKIVKE